MRTRWLCRPLAPLAMSVALVCAGGLVLHSQSGEASLQDRLVRLFPDATGFSDKTGSPPHFKAYGGPGGTNPVVGYAFYTTELEPLERGYDGPIQMLVGVDPRGRLTGALVVDHNEPYGYFSIDTPEYAAQFPRKSIRDRFAVGDDIDAVATATITVRSASRAVRNGARRIARAFLRPEDVQ